MGCSITNIWLYLRGSCWLVKFWIYALYYWHVLEFILKNLSSVAFDLLPLKQVHCQVQPTSRKENFLSIIASGSNINNYQKMFAKKMIKITVCEWKNSTVNKIKKLLFHNQPKPYIKLTYFNFYIFGHIVWFFEKLSYQKDLIFNPWWLV